MTIIARLLARMIVVRFVFILLGISAFVLTLDIVTYAQDVLDIGPGGFAAVGSYALFRAPAVLATFLPISVLLALLLALSELSFRNELTALWAAGLSPVRITMMLAPLALLLGGVNFLLGDQAVPKAAPVLREWGIGDYGEKKLTFGEKDPLWMRSGPDILRAGSRNRQASELHDVIIFRRDPDGLLREQILAAMAKQIGGRWELDDVVVYYRDNLPPSRLDRLIYSGALKPAAAGAHSGDPEEMSLGDLDYFIDNSGFGIRPAWVYQTWWHKRLTLLASAFVMVALCVPLATRFRRRGGLALLFAGGVALGFLFFIFDGIALTMGELGFVPGWLAAWSPVLGFAGIAAMLTVRTETV